MIEREHWASGLVSAVALVAIVAGFWVFTQQFSVAAHPGTDQNAYLVGGKMLVRNLSMGNAPEDPYRFVGRMWVAASDGRYYPKYPPGAPVIFGLVYGVGGASAAYLVNPVLTALALVATFLTARMIAGSFAGILGTLMLATSPVTLSLANNPNSHAAALCLVTWGAFFLLRWWQRGSFWRAAVAGTLLGCAVTVRYTEALFLLPLLLVSLFNLHWRRCQSWGQVATLLGCWTTPVALVLLFNRVTIGRWTAYDPTNESAWGSAFRWEHLAQNWETVIRQLNGSGLFFVLPIGLMGLVLLSARNWRLALVLWAWLLPGVLVYGSYYWLAHDDVRFSYLRFFLTVFPPVVIGAAWCMTRLAPAAPYSGRILRWVVAPLAALVIVLGAAAVNIYGALPILTNDQRRAAALAEAAERLRTADVPSDAILFGPSQLLNHLQFAGEYRLYATEDFDPAAVKLLERVDPGEPNSLDPARAKAQRDLWGDLAPDRFRNVLRERTAKALDEGKRVFVVASGLAGVPLNFADATWNRLDDRAYTQKTVSEWSEPEAILKFDRRRMPADEGRAKWRLIEVEAGKR